MSEQDADLSICPNCGADNVTLMRIEAGMKLRLAEVVGLTSVPAEACANCIREFSNQVSAGATLRIEEAKKAENRMHLWRNRVALVKQAKQLMVSRLYSDAAVAYEKYLRILEVVYERKPGELSADLFSNEARKQELTVISSVYWDLMRIYDVHERYRERQMSSAEKLAEFSRYTRVLPNLIKKAESEARGAKNPEAYKHFLKRVKARRGRCFIATAAFSGPAPEIVILCSFRDNVLRATKWGRVLIRVYYRISPPLADFLDAYPALKPPVRKALTWLAHLISVAMGPVPLLKRKAPRS